LYIGQLSGRLRRCDASCREERKASLEKDVAIREAQDTLDRRNLSIIELQRLLNERSDAMPWVAEALADLRLVHDEREARWLETKKHPARTAAETVRQHAEEKKRIRIEKRLIEYRLTLHEHLFPCLRDIEFNDAEKLADTKARETNNEEDPVANWLSKDEWLKLSEAERNQIALERYNKRTKSSWEIGRDFERFIGYHLETEGYDVAYNGALKGFDDFGRDLIVTANAGKTHLIQCKYRSKHKTTPESVVFQVLGSTISYYIERTGRVPSSLPILYKSVQPYIISSAPVAPRVRDIALTMGITIQDNWKMTNCRWLNAISPLTGERIYHLPMDQQYDRVKLSKPGECYVSTVAEAEAKGFRRAKRWVPAQVQ
jgi:hypothetical protein